MLEVDPLGFVAEFSRSDRSADSPKVTTLTDTESLAVMCGGMLSGDTIQKAGPQIVRRNAFQNWHTEYYAHDVEPLIHYRGSFL